MCEGTGNVVIIDRVARICANTRRKLQITDRSIVTDTGSTLVRICSKHQIVQVLVSTSETVPATGNIGEKDMPVSVATV